MALGIDNTICKTEFLKAARASLEADKPGSGTNADNPEVQKTFGMLGEAVYQIAIAHTEFVSDATSDREFWLWIADVDRWLNALSTWQKGVAQAATNWSPTIPAEQALKNALIAPLNPASPPTPPTQLKGRVQ